MLKPLPSFAAALVVMLAAADAAAMGFGAVRADPLLGHPLDFVVPVRLDGDETLEERCVRAEVVAGERRIATDDVQVEVLGGEAAGADRRVRVTTRVAIEEPVVIVTLAAGCPTRLTRRFTAFADPPGLSHYAAAAAAAQPAQVAHAAPAAPVSPAAPPAAPPARPAANPDATARQAPSAGAASAPAVAAATASSRPARVSRSSVRRPTAPRRAPAGPRLQLEAAPPVVAPAVAAAASAVAAAEERTRAAESALAAATSASQVAGARLAALETELAKLRAETKTDREVMALLRARLAEDELGSRLLPWLAAATAVLALLAAWLGWLLRQRSRQVASPWYVDDHESEAPSSVAPATLPGAVTPAVSSPVRAVSPSSAPLPASPTTAQPAANEPLPAAAARREVSVEEQIDLEQQADFFLVLGQDDAAVDLLLTHLRGTGGTSPMPYLKLLEIHHRRGERDAYERTRVRFNQRFNGVAPQWGSDPADGRTLEDYPQVLTRLQRLWWPPLTAMAELESLLFRRGPDAELFDLPAYQDVLFLYQLARDLHLQEQGEQRAGAPQVDVLLPLPDSDDGGVTVRHVDVEATSVLHPEERRPHVDLDLALDLDVSQPAEPPPRDSRSIDFDESRR